MFLQLLLTDSEYRITVDINISLGIQGSRQRFESISLYDNDIGSARVQGSTPN